MSARSAKSKRKQKEKRRQKRLTKSTSPRFDTSDFEVKGSINKHTISPNDICL